MLPRKLFSSKHRRVSDQLPKSNRTIPSVPSIERSKSVDTDATLLGDSQGQLEGDYGASATSSRGLSVDSGTIGPSLPTRSKSPRGDRGSDPTGLTLVYEPDGEITADIIFVHGLGGSSRLSWSKNSQLDLFWPREWLPTDPDIRHARIFTFGYNAFFLSSGQSTSLGISDFAKNLLYDMLYGRDARGQSLNIGQVPIIFVTHSMGGLVFKKAYLDGQLDKRYEAIVGSIKAVIFLSTPHRGANLAEFLQKVLSISFHIGSKQYVAELAKDGPFLRAINDQFRHIAPRLQIFSFYETLQTSHGFTSTMLLDAESAKLGYPGEICRSLNADHHNVCKFDSQQDPNYKVVLGALKSLVSAYPLTGVEATSQELQKLQNLLSVSGSPEHDLNLFWGRRAEGTCSWILNDPAVAEWTSSPSNSELLWLYGRPARGKSVMSCFLINHLKEQGATVQYFFFRAGDETKRSMGALLRCLAYQIALQHPAYRMALVSLADGGYKPKEADWKLTWKKLFTNTLFQLQFYSPLYWIIDGIDESGSPQHIFQVLSDINASSTPIHVLMTSRWTPSLSLEFHRTALKLPGSSALSIDQNTTDIRIYAQEELNYLSWHSSIKDEIMTKILEQANDNFLWVYLILEEIKECHTEDDVRERLSELPPGMESLYKHMEDTILRIKRPSDKSLCRQLLLWAIHARRSIDIDELLAILEPEFGHLLDLSSTISRLCGQFVVIEGKHRIALLHQTAREYLTTTTTLPFSLDAAESHNELFRKSLTAFMVKPLRSRIQIETPKSLEYRATSWVYHLQTVRQPDESNEQLDLLVRFFSDTSVLTWIQILACLGQLKILIETSHTLHSFVQRRRRTDAAQDPSFRRFEDLELLESWSRDLLKLPGKFGGTLSRDPKSIMTCIAPFCPQSSSIYRSFGKIPSASVRITGLPDDWDDRLATVSIGAERSALLIDCSGRYLAVVDNMGGIIVWDCTTFHQLQLIEHGEPISSICFSSKGDRMATYGVSTTKIWSPQSGCLTETIQNPSETQALCLAFVENDSVLLMGSDRRRVLRLLLNSNKLVWDAMDSSLLNDLGSVEGTYMNSPTALAISPDGTKIAAAYRRFPLTVWSLDPPRVLRRLTREFRGDQNLNALPFVSRISWHPNSEELLGIFLDGFAFRINVIDGTYQEQPPDPGQMPADILCSPDGMLFAIRGMHGTIKLYDYQTSALIYQLTSEDMVTAFTFSQDGRRFYDIRGSYCNIWEPNSLIRLSITDDHAANSSQAPDESVEQSNMASESFASDPVPIVLNSPMPCGPVVCLGDDEGLIELVDYSTTQRVELGHTPTRMSVEHIEWSGDGSRLFYAEVGGRISVIEIQSNESGWKHRRIERFKPKQDAGGIMQLLPAPDLRALLVAFRQSAQVWSLNPASLQAQYSHSTSSPRWLLHPVYSEVLISLTPYEATLYRWSDLGKISTWKIIQESTKEKQKNPVGSTQEESLLIDLPDETIDQAINTHCKPYILAIISRRTWSRKVQSRFLVFDSAATRNADGIEGDLVPLPIPSSVAALVDLPLNILKNERLVFIDRSLGVCTWPLKSTRGVDDVQCHFFIPRDWLPEQNLALLHVTSSGAILCPRKGKIAVMESSIGAAW